MLRRLVSREPSASSRAGPIPSAAPSWAISVTIAMRWRPNSSSCASSCSLVICISDAVLDRRLLSGVLDLVVVVGDAVALGRVEPVVVVERDPERRGGGRAVADRRIERGDRLGDAHA